MSDPYHIPDGELCGICGLTFYSRSYGGPGICPSCDCGNFGIQAIENQRKEIQRLAASVDRLTSDKARLASELAAEQESNTFLNNLHTSDAERIKALEAALRKLIHGYVNTLESGAIAIQAYGGKCDSVSTMEAGDPYLREARNVLVPNAGLPQAETTEPVKGAAQWCHLCQNVHDLMSACPPKETKPAPGFCPECLMTGGHKLSCSRAETACTCRPKAALHGAHYPGCPQAETGTES